MYYSFSSSAGIGRTGTYISLDWLLQEAASGDHVDILACVDTLRKDRVDMVQNVVCLHNSSIEIVLSFVLHMLSLPK